MKRSVKPRTTNSAAELAMESWPLSRFKPYPHNARIHDDRHVAEIAASMRAFGAVVPVLADPDGEIIAGHGRLKAAERLKLKSLPVVVLEGLSDAQKKALRLADNKIAANGRFDPAVLKIELQSLFAMEVEFELEVTGFSTAEIDLALDPSQVGQLDDPADACPEPPRTPVTQRGDLWVLGDHKLVCGDSRQMWTFARLMRTDEARMVLSDPPFNVSVQNHVGGLGKIKHEEFAFASGEMDPAAFTAFLKTVFDNAAEYSLNGALHYHFMDWRHMKEMIAAGEDVYTELKNLCVWAKDQAGMGSHYRSQHELCFVWKYGKRRTSTP